MAERLQRGWFQKDAFAHFRDKFGWGEDSRASYGNWERGTAEPSGEVARTILREFGYDELPPEPQEPAPDSAHTEGAGSIVEAIDRQTAAIEAQTRMLALVLSRLVPGVGEPELDELAAQRMYDELRRPRSVPAPVKP